MKKSPLIRATLGLLAGASVLLTSLATAPAAAAAAPPKAEVYFSTLQYQVGHPISGTLRNTADVYVINAEGKKVHLEAKTKKGWKYVSQATVRGYKATLVLPKNTAKQAKTQLRFRIPTAKGVRGSTSKSWTITTANPKKYTGYAKRAYDAMKRWCPNTPIVLESSRSYKRRFNGHVTIRDGYRGYIHLSTGLSKTRLNYAAKHECAHVLQWDKASKASLRGWEKLSTKTNSVHRAYGAIGIERQADCMSKAMGVNIPRIGAYTRSCSPAQMKAARGVLSGRFPR